MLAALKVILFGVSFGTFCDYFQMGESTVRQAVSKLAEILNNEEVMAKYLRKLTKCDAMKVSELHNNQHGIPGMIGCLDCMHVPWENCPNYLHGQHVGKEGVPTLVVEASCDYNLYFWHHDFGHAGALNDLNIWERSELHKSFLDGTIAKMDFDFEIGGEKITKLFFLVDGIYPQLSRFVKTISIPLTHVETIFAKWQELACKKVERGFGVITKKLKFLQNPVRFNHADDIFYVIKLCFALHNAMVVN